MVKRQKIWPSSGNSEFDRFQKVIYDEFCRHLVCMSVCVTYLENGDRPGEQDEITCSGFVIDINGQWIIATAGHFLEDLEKGTRSRKYRVDSAMIADFFGPDATVAHPTPFPITDLHKAFVCDDAMGLDVGFIFLGHLFAEGLKSNGIRAISRDTGPSNMSLSLRAFTSSGFLK